MRQKLNIYKACSIACAIVWAIILLAFATCGDSTTAHNVGLVFAGW